MKSAYPILVTIAFLLVGMLTHRWNIAWVLFLTIPVFYILVSSKKEKENEEKTDKKEKDDDWSDY